ncbi:MAG: 6-bladed beta-propeller [Candidatus Aminicenantes bacterium]|nr:6-bladed beta-propeller [Candidatus Aminicenantes bacterium]
MNRYLKIMSLSLIIALFFIGCTKQDKIEKIFEDGVEIITNPLQPYKSKDRFLSFKLEDDFRIDTEEDFYAEIGLSEITSFALDSAGNIYLINAWSSEFSIFKFDNFGNYVKCFGRKGQGPGEIQRAFFICVDADERVVTTDLSSLKIVFFDNNGELSDEIKLPPQMSSVLPLRKGNYLTLRTVMDRAGQQPGYGYALSIFNSEFNEIIELDRQRQSSFQTQDKYIGTYMTFEWEVFDDHIYVMSEERGYEILVFDLEGNLIKKIKKEYLLVDISEEYKKAFLDQYPSNVSYTSRVVFPEHLPPYNYFFISDEGWIFVMTYEKGNNPGEYIFDIFNNDGVFVGRKSLSFQITPATRGVNTSAIIQKNKYYHLHKKENGYSELIVYKMIWE